ncbi:MAG TPA: 5-formyltetrahydrofolate cyclo-ligase, partial [Arenicellales bacterium]|nr:5-formyltetrahydrofolate cyclo-ligase [Arenicellales bacterium]
MNSELNQPGDKIKQWRRATRRKLIAARLEVGRPRRQQWDAVIEERLRGLLPDPRGRVFGLCWPFKGEFDGRRLAGELIEQGGVAALPAVTAPRAPVEFRRWRPGDPVERGAHDIPVPSAGEPVEPDVLLVPLVAFDNECYRLGYGTGHFDRTLAAMSVKPLAIGVGYELSRVDTIFPQPHDVPMDVVVT